MIFMNASIVATVTVVLVTLLTTAYEQTTQQRVANSTTSNPYWRRPGCHQVGHTRTISIPGCVKFNLSTNACRGYCMSYSIPIEEDIGPPSDELEIEELKSISSEQEQQQQEEESQVKKQRENENAANSYSNNNQLEALKKKDHQSLDWINPSTIIRNYIGRRGKEAGSGIINWPKTQLEFKNDNFLDKNTLMSSGSQTSSLGASAVRRDVISVSQCCNMMSTEDVIVNLRCANGTRQYIFKSAKSCECVFCKHL